MSFWEKWYWANYLRGTNPITSFIGGLIKGIWIPILISIILCFLTDPQWNHAAGMKDWSPIAYTQWFFYCWGCVFYGIAHCLGELISYIWNSFGEFGVFCRQVFWLGGPHNPGN
jgi:hypothetical protein